MKTLFARHPSPVTNGPADCGAALCLGALAGNSSEQALGTGLNVCRGVSENLR